MTVPIILIDTREPENGGWEPFFTVPTVRGKLDLGDYSLPGCGQWIAVERKALNDLIGCLCSSRERFTRELAAAARIPHFYVIVEGTYEDIFMGRYLSAMNRKSAWESVVALSMRYNIPFLFAENQRLAAVLCESILLRWYREHVKAMEAIQKAARAAEGTNQ